MNDRKTLRACFRHNRQSVFTWWVSSENRLFSWVGAAFSLCRPLISIGFGFRDTLVFRRVLRLLWRSNRWLTIAVSVVTIAEALLAVGVLYVLKLLIDAASSGVMVTENSTSVPTISIFVALAAGLIFLASCTQILGNYLRAKHGMTVADHVVSLIHKRAMSVDLAFYESPEYFDLLERARASGPQRPAAVVTSALLLIKSVTFLAAALLLMVNIDWRIVPALVVSVLPLLYVRMKFTRRQFLWQKERTQRERQASYFELLLTSDRHAKQLRLGGLGDYFSEKFKNLRDSIRSEALEIEKKKAAAEFFVAGTGAVVFLIAALYLFAQASISVDGLGDLVLFILLFRRADTSAREAITNFSKLYEDRQYLSQIFEFLAINAVVEETVASLEPPERIREGVKFHSVDFRYPGAKENVLADIDIEIGAGQVVGLVGHNGSGKSSLVKLLTRLYDPTGGKVTLDGENIVGYDLQQYRSLFNVVFQDPFGYADTVSENVRLGDIHSKGTHQEVYEACRKGGSSEFIADLPYGFETKLTRMFDNGFELSGGQWQRIALSRGFFGGWKYLVLDEPTSSLDPRAELEFLRICVPTLVDVELWLLVIG
jgi:ATP-binding cassette subfamily B protein